MSAHGLAFKDQSIAVVHDSIEDRVGNGAITQVGVPLIDRKLARDERGASIVAIIEDLKQIAHGLVAQRR